MLYKLTAGEVTLLMELYFSTLALMHHDVLLCIVHREYPNLSNISVLDEMAKHIAST